MTAMRALPQMWQDRFGYAPLLMETFTDPEAHAGTCYRSARKKVAAEQAVSFTSGMPW